jgi:cell division protein FtsN
MNIMKKYFVLCAGLCLAISFTSCRSSESAYKKAYEKAQAQAAQQQMQTPTQTQPTETPVVTPVVTRPATQTQVVDNYDNVSVRQERVAVVNGDGLSDYSVVVGSFSVIANAEGLQQKLRKAGYSAQIVKNEERNMYRVVAATFTNKADAVRSRDNLRASYPDAWLLFFTR